jgi:hypothetical protein
MSSVIETIIHVVRVLLFKGDLPFLCSYLIFNRQLAFC